MNWKTLVSITVLAYFGSSLALAQPTAPQVSPENGQVQPTPDQQNMSIVDTGGSLQLVPGNGSQPPATGPQAAPPPPMGPEGHPNQDSVDVGSQAPQGAAQIPPVPVPEQPVGAPNIPTQQAAPESSN